MLDLEMHFKREDSIKNLLYNATTEEQEKIARKMLEEVKSEEEIYTVN